MLGVVHRRSLRASDLDGTASNTQRGTLHALNEIMFGKKCPFCGVRLGDYAYADACPHCHEVMNCKLVDLTPVYAEATAVKSWPVRAFFKVRDFVES